MSNYAFRSFFLFYYRIITFFDFILRQLSLVQEALAATAKSIDVATTEKRCIKTILDAMTIINCTMSQILIVKNAFLTRFSAPFHSFLNANIVAMAESIGPSDWPASTGSFPFFMQDMDRLHEVEGGLSFVSLLLLGHVAPSVDLAALQILQLVTSVTIAADAISNLSKSFVILQQLSVEHEEESEELIHNVRRLAEEIRTEICLIDENFQKIDRELVKCESKTDPL